MRKLVIAPGAVLMIVVAVCLTTANPQQQRRPNIIFILIDDLRWDDLGIAGHPFVKTPNIDRIGREGTLFRNAFVTNPLCSPSRASFLTGQYPHTHGITDNVDRSAASHKLITFPLLLQQSGYATAFIGKWHMGNDDSRRPGFDRWISFKGQGSYIDPEINEDGRDVKPSGYITDLLTGYATEFIKRKHNKPYLIYLAHKAIHPEVMQHDDGSVNLAHAERFIPAERHRSLFSGQRIPRRPSAMQPPVGKPALQRKIDDLPPLGAGTATPDEAVLGRLRSLIAIEEGVGEIMKALKETNQLDNTVIVLTSDNGYFYGEHGLSVERRLAYEESIRMPLLIRYPKAVKAGTVRDEFALNIDLAPTLLELAGVSVPARMEGHSLVPLLKAARTDWRKSFLIEYYSDRVFPRIRQMGYKAIRNERWKYIHYFELDGMDELYDLKTDPYEMTNVINQPDAANIVEEMKLEMQRLLKAPQSASANSIGSPQIAELARKLRLGEKRALEQFWTSVQRQGTPLVEPIDSDKDHYLVTFLWRGDSRLRNVLLISGLSNLSYSRTTLAQNLLSQLPGTDVWYRTYRVRSDARFTYQFSVNDSLVPSEEEKAPATREAVFQPDPLNRRHVSGPTSGSFVELPDAPPQQWFLPRDETPKGQLKRFPFVSKILGNERTLTIYTPPNYDPSGRPYHLLIFMDAEAYTSDIPAPVILDNLLNAARIPPVVALFIGNVPAGQPAARTLELSCHEPFSRFLVDELLPWIRTRYRISSVPAETVIGGASRGGLAAMCAAIEHPEQFGNVSSQSGFFVYKDRNWFKNVDPASAPDSEFREEMAWEQYGVVMQRVAAGTKLPLRIYLDIGKFENDFHPSPLVANRHLRDVLIAKGYTVKYQEFSGHHSAVNWRGTLPDALMFLLGK